MTTLGPFAVNPTGTGNRARCTDSGVADDVREAWETKMMSVNSQRLCSLSREEWQDNAATVSNN